ncbi:hypothetical protein HZS61_010730 [Fusarium oxysporum f. sp. conglutinans]|uniref:WW domain-containing protein n=1 Tax=Fusarium oxysporum f. sp. conglutinans TaxID=100902 RepID=A0A8H6GWS6_FUSOX|nr:hypothetical protein HZS61_010730 [Fusarium oxysporum f. sp. conglutinans]
MAEAVGLAASIIAIVELSAKVGKLCVQYSTAAGNARADITRLQNRLKDLNVCLEAAQRLLDDPKNTKLATSRSLVDSLNACETELAEVQDRLHPGSARKAMRRFGLRALKWPFDSKEISTVVSNLEHYKQTITLCLQVDQTTILLDMSQRVEGLSLRQQGETGIARAPCFNVPFDRDNDFVARPDMTAWLRDKYNSSTGRMALVGMGGFGKSQVAINFAYFINDEASDVNIFWVHASSKPRFEEAYRAIAERMKLPKRDEPSTDILTLVRDWLQNDESGPWLMILDNADDINLFYPKGTDERSLASFLPKRHNGTILVTSRSLDVAERLTGSHKNIFQVSTMDEAQGLHLITNKLTGEFEHDAAVELLQALDYIPLAITQAAAYITRRSPRESVESYLEAFQESDQKKNSLLEVDLGDLRRDETVSNSVITTWQVTFEKIRHERPSAANLLSFMSLFDHKGIPEFALHYYNGEPADSKDKVDGFEDDLDVLRSYSLVSVTAVRDVFELHATVQTCTRAWSSSSDTLPKLKRLFLISMCALALGAIVMKDMGHRAEALSLQQACVDGYRESLGPEHPKTVSAVQVLAWWEAETGLSEQDLYLKNFRRDVSSIFPVYSHFNDRNINTPSPAPQSTEQSYQSYNNQYQNQQQGHGQPPYPGQNQQNSGYQSYHGQSQQSYPDQHYAQNQTQSPQPPAYNTYQPPQQPQHQQWPSSPAPPGQPVQSFASAHAPYGAPAAPNNHSIQSPPTIVAPGTAGHGHPCPTPPRWVPYWSEQSQQWYYVETSGRSSWQAPFDLPPLQGMPAFPGSLNSNNRSHGRQTIHPGQPQYANPQDSRPSLPEKEKKSSTFLAAAGGFAAGGAAGYFVKERIDKRKAKKHGRTAEDFSDFAHFPAWEVDLECNICDQVISGPYAHCKKCDGGDYDICRDCLAQGEVCKGKGKHNLVKVYPKYYCDVCNLLIKGGFYYCGICNNGDWDTCQKCFDAGNTCRGMERGETHNLTHLYMPEPKFKKGTGKYDSSSSSDSD